MIANSNIIKLNIGGTVFQTTKTTLTRYDGFFKTLLETEIPVTKDDSGAIFIDRDPKHFRLILNFMRYGHVAIPKSDEDVQEIKTEAQYYLLDGLVELCKAENCGIDVKKFRFLETIQQHTYAFLESKKKGVIVIFYPSDWDIHDSFKMAFYAKKYGDEFDVHFCRAPPIYYRMGFRVRRNADNYVECPSPDYFEACVVKMFPTED